MKPQSSSVPDGVVGFVGLGDMGGPIAENLQQKFGRPIQVFDRKKDLCSKLERSGAVVASSLAQLAQDCQSIGICVWNELHLVDAIFGEGGLLSGNARDRTLIVHSTVTPAAIAKIADGCRAKGWKVLDAPVSGMRMARFDGTLTVMVGGNRKSFDDHLHYFKCIGKEVFHVGEREGAGEVAKLCNGLLYLCTVFCGIEALKLAKAYGVSEKTVFDIAAVSTGNSWYVQNPDFLDNMMLTHPQPEDLGKDVWEAVKAAKDVDLQLVIGGAVAMISPRLSRERRADLLSRSETPDS